MTTYHVLGDQMSQHPVFGSVQWTPVVLGPFGNIVNACIRARVSVEQGECARTSVVNEQGFPLFTYDLESLGDDEPLPDVRSAFPNFRTHGEDPHE